jgi:DnaK suppressor protein
MAPDVVGHTEGGNMICTRVDIADGPVGERRADIRRMLVERQRELLNEIHIRVRDVREEGSGKYHDSADPADTLDAEAEDDLALALIQMKAEVLERVTEALRQFDEGTYGYCVDCGEVIASSRLRAMPFAIRCKDCEELREHMRHRERTPVRRVTSAFARDTGTLKVRSAGAWVRTRA